MITGVIPAAGKGSRWGGYFKELLPLTSRRWLLNEAIYNMYNANASRVVVVTRHDKVATHAYHLVGMENIIYTIQEDNLDIYGAMKASYVVKGKYNLFQMPDTYVPPSIFTRMLEPDKTNDIVPFQIGVHRTRNPERFGIIHDGEVINKDIRLNNGDEYMAWGTLFWTDDVIKYWIDLDVKTYTQAIQTAMDKFKWRTLEMEYYYDMASFADYSRFLDVYSEL